MPNASNQKSSTVFCPECAEVHQRDDKNCPIANGSLVDDEPTREDRLASFLAYVASSYCAECGCDVLERLAFKARQLQAELGHQP